MGLEGIRRDSKFGKPVHFGIFVESTDDVDTAIARLESAGLAESIEREDTCCYANQTKVWTTDPDGRRWEVYTVHADTEGRDTEDTVCCLTESGDGRCSDFARRALPTSSRAKLSNFHSILR